MSAKKKLADEPEEPSRAAGRCVLTVLVGVAFAVVFRASDAAGVLLVWVVGGALLWRAARRRVSDSSATPPPGEGRPSCRECAGHELVSVTPSETQKGMLIYSFVLPGRPNHTHIHLSKETA